MTQATPNFTERIEGVSPAVLPGPPSWQERYTARFPNSPAGYAAYAYDCVMLIALAAAGARTDAGFGIAERMTDTSRGGTQCRAIDTCLALVNEGLNLVFLLKNGKTVKFIANQYVVLGARPVTVKF